MISLGAHNYACAPIAPARTHASRYIVWFSIIHPDSRFDPLVISQKNNPPRTYTHTHRFFKITHEGLINRQDPGPLSVRRDFARAGISPFIFRAPAFIFPHGLYGPYRPNCPFRRKKNPARLKLGASSITMRAREFALERRPESGSRL